MATKSITKPSRTKHWGGTNTDFLDETVCSLLEVKFINVAS